MQMVEADEADVERKLHAGDYACPACEGELRPWGHARRRTLGRGGPSEGSLSPLTW